MKTFNLCFIAGMVACGFMLHSEPAFAAPRGVTMQRCTKMARAQVPRNQPSTIRNRTAVYKACMVNRGHRP